VQASLIQEFEKEDIDQSTHPMVTVTPHTQKAIGVQIEAEAESSTFEVIVPQDSAVPVRKTKVLQSLWEGELILRISEGERKIKITKPEPKPKAETNGDVGPDGDPDFDDDEEAEAEIRETFWTPLKPLGEITAQATKGQKVEVTVNVGADLGVSITARELGASSGVRGNLSKPEVAKNSRA
jgi:hypothetical protein